MYTKHGIVEDYRFFLHAFVILEIAKIRVAHVVR